MTVRDPREAEIKASAHAESQALGRVPDVDTDHDIYREMVQILLEQAHDYATLTERQREAIRRGREEQRRLRALLLETGG